MNFLSLIGLIVSLLGIVFIIFKRRKISSPYGRCFGRSSFVFFIICILILIFIAMHWSYLEYQLDSFDLNSNRNIEMEEQTEEYRVALEKFSKDTARNFAFLTGAVFSLFISILFLSIDLISVYLKIKKSKHQSILSDL